MQSRIRFLTVFAICASHVPSMAQAQNCPEVQSARERLVEFRSRKTQQMAALQQMEATGPQTLEGQDRLDKLRTERPGQIQAERDQFRTAKANKRAQLLADRNQRIATLSRQRDQLSARNAAELGAQQAKYNDLVAKGPQTADLEAQARAAAQRESSLAEEKRRVIADLRNGKFCSQCGRSAYEIEKSGTETFEQHLVSVSGYAVMRPEQIQARSDAYDQQIAQARSQAQQLQNSVSRTRSDHANATATALAEITRLKVDGPAAVAGLEQQIQSTIANSDRSLAAVDDEVRTGLQRFADMETQRASDERGLDAAISQKNAAYQKQLSELRQAVTDSEAAEAPLKASFLQAANQCRAVIVDAQQQAAEQDNERRHAYDEAQRHYADASYRAVLETEAARRSSLDAGNPPPVRLPTPSLASLQGALRSASGMIQSARRSWKEGLGLRETSYYRGLDASVRQKIDKNIETFTSARNITRAVLKDSIGRLRSGSNMALLRNALGVGNGVAPDLSAAVDAAKPSLSSTAKKQLMPTLEAMAIEAAVDARERQLGRSFDPQERVAQRGYMRAMAYILDRKKQGEAMIDTYSEAIDTFMVNLSKDSGESQ